MSVKDEHFKFSDTSVKTADFLPYSHSILRVLNFGKNHKSYFMSFRER